MYYISTCTHSIVAAHYAMYTNKSCSHKVDAFAFIIMARITKLNARETLTRTLENFKTVTNESVGVLYSWNGQLMVLGCEPFRQYISEGKRMYRNLLPLQRQ